MNVVKCKNGHFFDSDTYRACPHCGAETENSNTTTAASDKTAKKGFSLFDRDKKKQTRPQTVSPAPAPVAPPQPADLRQIPVQQAPQQLVQQPVQPRWDNATESLFNFDSNGQIIKQEKTQGLWQPSQETVAETSRVCAPAIVCAPSQPTDSMQSPQTDPPIAAPSLGADSLRDAIRKTSATSEGKTMSYFSSVASASNDIQSISEPVVGWLVCISGNHLGESFQISAGKNSIGRGEGNRIILSKDVAISREKHALIVYEPKKRNFYLQPGDASGLTYLNDDYITESKRLTARDTLELGDSKFLFVPLCGADFTWEDYIS